MVVGFMVSCGKSINNEDQSNRYFLSSEISDTMVVVGNFNSGEANLTIPEEALDSFFRWYFYTIDENVVYSSAEIDDDLSNNNGYVYLIFNGLSLDYESRILGLELRRDYTDSIYYISTEKPGGKWTCTGVNCDGCSPRRKAGRWSKVIGCDCSGSPIDPDKPSGCKHSTSGGGNGSTWIGILVKIITIFT